LTNFGRGDHWIIYFTVEIYSSPGPMRGGSVWSWASKRNFARLNKTALEPQGQFVLSKYNKNSWKYPKYEKIKSNFKPSSWHKLSLVTHDLQVR
jgi:hypothetical protein